MALRGGQHKCTTSSFHYSAKVGILELLPYDEILSWVAGDPTTRASLLAGILPNTFEHDHTLEALILSEYGDIKAVSSAFAFHLLSSGEGSLSEQQERAAANLDALATRTQLPNLLRWAESTAATLHATAEKEREWERERWLEQSLGPT